MVFVYEGEEYIVEEYKAGTQYGFKFDKTRPHKMSTNVEAYVYGLTEDGYVKDYVGEYSVMKYCVNQFKKQSNNKELLTLVSNVLTYGAAVQKYVNPNVATEDLVTTKVEALNYKLTPTAYTGIASGNQIVYDDVAPLEYRWTKLTLMLGSSTELYYRFKAPTIEGLQIKVEYNDQVVMYESEDIVSEGNGVYRIAIGCLKSTEYIYDVKATFVINGVEASSMTDSINSYLYRNVTKYDESTQEMMKALYVYGESVRAYFGK
jgi:hypothetical protein